MQHALCTGSTARLGFRAYLDPKSMEIMAFMAVITGLGLLFYIFLGLR